MSASSSVSTVIREIPKWLLPLNESDRELFYPITPCVYREKDVPPRKLQKTDHFFCPKYIPLIFNATSGTPYKVYLYLRSLALLGMSARCANKESVYEDVKNVLMNMSPIEKRKLKLFEYVFNNYRAQEEYKRYHDPSRFFSQLPKYNKRVLVSLFNNAIAAFDPTDFMDEFVDTEKNCSLQIPSRTVRFTDNSLHFIANFDSNRITIITIPGIIVGEGTHTVAYKAYNYSLGKFQVYKKVKLGLTGGSKCRSRYENNIYHMQREIDILGKIYRKVPEGHSIQGLVDRVTAIFTFNYPINPFFCREILITEYETDLDKFNLDYNRKYHTLPNLLNGALDLFKGLKYLQRVKILHGDIKPANIFVKCLNPLSLCIGDVGGALSEDKIRLSMAKIEGTICSPAYYNQKDFIAMARAVQAKDVANWIQIHRARDLAAVVLTVLETFSSVDFMWSGTQHVKELTRILVKEKEGLFWPVVHKFLELLDLGQATKGSIAEILGSGGFDDERLTDFFVDVLQDEWLLRPTVDEVIDKIEKLIPLEV